MQRHGERFGMKSVQKRVLPLFTAAVLIVGGFAFSTTEAVAQRRTARRTTPSIYAQAYQKGYGSGFTQGQTDWRNSAPRDFERSTAYQDRARYFDPNLGHLQQYGEGYQLGFEMGYTDGYFGRTRNAVVPANAAVLAKAAALADAQIRERERQAAQQQPVAQNQDPAPVDVSRPRSTGPLRIPADTELRLQLTSPIDTRNNRVGDKFTATVIFPGAYDGATVEGHISTLKRSGRITGRTELALAFDTITLQDGRSGPLEADLQKIIESEKVQQVDEEGRVESGSRSRDSQVRGGVGAAAGAVIGGVVGGAKGAVLGAILGGAAGVGTVYVEGNKDLILDRGTELVIKTAGRQR